MSSGKARKRKAAEQRATAGGAAGGKVASKIHKLEKLSRKRALTAPEHRRLEGLRERQAARPEAMGRAPGGKQKHTGEAIGRAPGGFGKKRDRGPNRPSQSKSKHRA